ncbi:MAG: hypothetical protein AseanaTS_25270 [Candidatus Pelagadaptatus aseana]|uniref:FecR family protein n=1 Tax=Candidatus Pelagadaptatus aseana TaxID=3120508 RepID=UPI0039B2C09E
MNTSVSALLAILLAVVSSNAQASSGVGKVIVSVGQVEAVNTSGEHRTLKRRSPIFVTDTVATREDSKAQLRFSDGSMVSLGATSLFKVEQYQLGGDAEKAVYHLLKGSLQAISGAIGKVDKQDYLMKTPVATIGIRGTYYQLALTDDGGLVGGVKEGAIVVTNKQGTANIAAGEYFSMASASAPVMLMAEPPLQLLERGEASNDASDSADSAANTSDSQVQQTVTGVNTSPGSLDENAGSSASAVEELDSSLVSGTLPGNATSQRIDVTPTGSPAAAGAAYGIASIYENVGGVLDSIQGNFIVDGNHKVYIGGGNEITYIEEYEPGGSCNVCQFAPHLASLTDQGVVGTNAGGSNVNVNWGRWVGNYIVAENGNEFNPVGQNFHVIYSDQLTDYTDIAALNGAGSATFVYSGGTNPTDQNGVAGTMNTASLTVDFNAQQFTAATMNMTVNSTTYDLMLSGGPVAIDAGPATTMQLQPVSVGSYSGTMDAQFVGKNPAAVSDLSLINSYEVYTGTGKIVGVGYYE